MTLERAEQIAAKRPDLTRDEQIADALKFMTALLDGRPASKVHVEVTRGGTYKVTAEAEGDKVVRPQFGTGRGK
jgi:hypothetical protein